MAFFVSSSSTSGVRAALAGGEDLFVAAGVTVGSTDSTAVVGGGNSHSAVVSGTLVSAVSALILGTDGNSAGQRLSVRPDGELIGFGGDGAVLLQGKNSVVSNAGYIHGLSGLGLVGEGGTSTVRNSGTIEGETFYGIGIGGAQDSSISNSGTIEGKFSFINLGSGSTTLTNTGTMRSDATEGGIYLGNGNDTYNGKTGHAVGGAIFGGAGTDTIAAGTDDDRISGGGDGDTLFGGKGNDTFVFDAAPSAVNADVIQDFAQASGNNDRFELEDAVFTKLGKPGMLAAKLFKDISKTALDADDRILYKSATGDLLFDADGSGKGKAELLAHLDTKPALTFADFFVV